MRKKHEKQKRPSILAALASVAYGRCTFSTYPTRYLLRFASVGSVLVPIFEIETLLKVIFLKDSLQAHCGE